MSFRDMVTFSMIASQERQHAERLPKSSKYRKKILPIATLYGGNASGKTNFFKALSFAQELIVKGTQPENLIPIEPFKLDDKSADRPSRFIFELLIDETIYEYSFAVTRNAILEEKLVLISSSSEKVLYNRRNGKISFHESLKKDEFLRFAFKGTRDNQLFLTNSVSQNIGNFKYISQWFKETLVLIAPDSRFGSFEHFVNKAHPLYTAMNEVLSQLDTGVIRLDCEMIPFENLSLSETSKKNLQEIIKEGEGIRFSNPIKNERYLVMRKKGELIAQKLVAYHLKTNGTKKEVKFEFRFESDGTQRIIDLLPAFLELTTTKLNKVYVIDEIDRSLHTVLVRQLIGLYLEHCSSKKRTQLLVTTHDIQLMDQQLLRRDEMWVTERDVSGCSSLISFSDYKDVRYDKDIRRSYLQGRLGGIPRILLKDILTETDGED